jgi:hypothetical protein
MKKEDESIIKKPGKEERGQKEWNKVEKYERKQLRSSRTEEATSICNAVYIFFFVDTVDNVEGSFFDNDATLFLQGFGRTPS